MEQSRTQWGQQRQIQRGFEAHSNRINSQKVGSLFNKSVPYLSTVGVVAGAAFGMLYRTMENLPGTFRSSAVCRAGFENGALQFLNGSTQWYVKAGVLQGLKFVPPLLPVGIAFSAAVLRATAWPRASEKANGIGQRLINEMKRLPWQQISITVALVALTSLTAVTQTWWVALVPGLVFNAVDPSGHVAIQFGLGLALGMAANLARNCAHNSNNCPVAKHIQYVAYGALSVLSLALTVGNTVALANTAAACHTDMEVYGGAVWAAALTASTVVTAMVFSMYNKVART